MRAGLHTVRALLAEAARAELSEGGQLIDLGTASQQKYTLGGWKNGWGKNELAADRTTFAKVLSRAVPLRVVVLSDDVKEVVARLRAPVRGQRVSLLVDGKLAGNGAVDTAWSVVRFPVRKGTLDHGRHELSLLFASVHKGAVRAEVDWVWLSRQAGATPPIPVPRALTLALGGRTRRALAARPPRRYSFYLQVPERAALVFDYGSAVATRFAVRAIADGVGERELWSAAAKPEHWAEAKVDLSALAGRAVRLDLVTTGPAGAAGWGEPEIMIPSGAKRAAVAAAPAGARARNVILIVMDTARADVFKPLNPKSKVDTPTYDALARDGTLFAHAFANENWTKPSVATILSGLYPSTHGAKTDSDVLSNDVTLISERMHKNHIQTAAFIANGYCSDKFGFKQGWGTYKNYIRESKPSEAEYVYGDALAWLKKHHDRRFFLYLQTIDPHVPYRAKKGFTDRYFPGTYQGPIGPMLDGHEQADISRGKKKASARDYDWIRALYYGEISYGDDQMGKFFAALRALGILDETLVVVTNDHGEELGDHGHLGHGHTLYEELLRSPLLMRYPPLFPAGKRIPDVVELVDIVPTILDAAGLPAAKEVEGTTLLPLVNGGPERPPGYAVSEFLDGKRALHVGHYKLVQTPGSATLYDLATDPGETKDRADDLVVARRLCEILLGEGLAVPNQRERQLDKTARRRYRSHKVKMDPVLKRQLEALGYFGG